MSATINKNRRRRSPARKRADAIHESSHAVAAELCGVDCTRVEIVQTDDSRGRCCHRPAGNVRVKLIIAWAGLAGEIVDAQQRRRPLPRAAKSVGSDVQDAERQIADWLGARWTEKRRDWCHVGAIKKARELLDSHWTCVLLIADLVLARKSISAKTVRSAMTLGKMIPRER